METVYIVAAKRSAIGSFGGSLKTIPAPRLGAQIIEASLAQSGFEPALVDQTIVGNVIQGGQGMGPGRQASVYAGIPHSVPAYTVNMLCGSGMKALMLGADAIATGQSEVVVAGGMESMSLAPFTLTGSTRWGHKLGSLAAEDSLLQDGLTDVFGGYHMGITAENIAKKHGITREQQDAFAAESQKRAAAAQAAGYFTDEIAAVQVAERKKTWSFDSDEFIRPDTSAETLGGLRPAFDKAGTVTAGNASGINDGAAFLVLTTDRQVVKNNLTPMAKIVAYDQAALDPAVMGLGPVPAIAKALNRAGKTLADMELIELNEAFAAQSLGVLMELAQDHGTSVDELLQRTNVNGGAIALGHPIGASGARIVVTLIHELARRNLKTGLASLCIGGGMGTALIVERM